MLGESFYIVAVDGGAASGKSSTSRRVAEKLHFLHVDTGAHYRAVTFASIEESVAVTDAKALEQFLGSLSLGVEIEEREAFLLLNEKRLADAKLRSPQVNASVSKVAAIPEVRETVKAYQRSLAEVAREAGFNGLIMDGRDIGTVIFPQADLKVFLFADEATRAARRASEGQTDSIAARDKMDAKRKTAPLAAAEDAVKIDNSELSLEQVVDQIVDLIGALERA